MDVGMEKGVLGVLEALDFSKFLKLERF